VIGKVAQPGALEVAVQRELMTAWAWTEGVSWATLWVSVGYSQ